MSAGPGRAQMGRRALPASPLAGPGEKRPAQASSQRILSRVIERDAGLSHHAQGIGILDIEAIGKTIELFIPAAEMQTRTQVLVFPCQVVTIAYNIREQ